MKTIAALLDGWEHTMLRSCLQGHMGRVVTLNDRPDSALLELGDFCFLAGRPDIHLLELAGTPLLVPQTQGWCELIEHVLGDKAVPFTRYATQYGTKFHRETLARLAAALPPEYELEPIDGTIYSKLMAARWSRDLCGNFTDGDDFARRGTGRAVLYQGNPVAGASSYAVFDGGIEIEIDTAPAFRDRGLATACGARLILDCLERGLYPNWDAHDSRSLHLAEKLGYRLARPYRAYWVEERARA